MIKIVDKITSRDVEGRYLIEILYEDNDIIVVNKPAGLLTIPDHWDKEKACLKEILESNLKKNNTSGKIFVVHRLDKDTSGVMVFAKNSLAHKNLSLQFENREVSKKYLAVVWGHPFPSEGLIDEPISKKMKKGGQKFVDHKNGLKSQTKYKTIKKYKDFSLIEAAPFTGRMHQIRVHMAHLGNSLAVDLVYSNPEKIGIEIGDIKRRAFKKNKRNRKNIKKEEETRYIIERLTLHASELSLLHSESKKKLAFSALLPKDFSSLLKQLDKWNSLEDS
ncbi:MAG: RluA family pseudouridine synthase [Calditrichia bacterium]|nr:RluA family pseudouridine synthase [Calditrichia bacterium]